MIQPNHLAKVGILPGDRLLPISSTSRWTSSRSPGQQSEGCSRTRTPTSTLPRLRLPKLQRVWYFRYVTSAALPWKASARLGHGYNNRQYPVSATALSSYLSRSCLLCSKYIVGKPSIHRGTKKHFEDWEDGGNIMFVLYSSMAVIYFTWWGIFINVVIVMLWSLVSYFDICVLLTLRLL